MTLDNKLHQLMEKHGIKHRYENDQAQLDEFVKELKALWGNKGEQGNE